MLRTSTSFLLAAIVFSSCKNETANTGEPAPDTVSEPPSNTAVEPPPPASPTCYLGAENRDTTRLRLTINGDAAEGSFDWIPWEKDRSRGTLKGTFKGDTLFARYKYMIEGMNQTEDKVFVRRGDEMLELYGELTDNNGVLKLKPGAALKVRSRLKKVDCGMLK